MEGSKSQWGGLSEGGPVTRMHHSVGCEHSFQGCRLSRGSTSCRSYILGTICMQGGLGGGEGKKKVRVQWPIGGSCEKKAYHAKEPRGLGKLYALPRLFVLLDDPDVLKEHEWLLREKVADCIRKLLGRVPCRE